MRVILCLFAACAALVLAGSAGAGSQSFMDASGEVPGSADISGVSASNDLGAGTLTFQVQTTWPAWDPNTFFAILVDSDQNASTGTAGFDYVLTGDRFGGTVVNTTQPHVDQVQSSLANGLWTITVPTADIGNPQAVNFFVLTQVGPDQAHPYEDRAPDSGTWTYSLVPVQAPPPPTTTTTTTTTPTPPPPAPTVSVAGATWGAGPTHGKQFRITGIALALSDGTVSRARGVACAATLGGKRLAGIGRGGCTFRLPATAKGRRLIVKVSGTYAASTISKRYAFKVR